MGLTQVPAAAGGVTHNIQAFTSSTTWTVPTSAKYVDVLVVGGGTGGIGGSRGNYNSNFSGVGGGITVLRDIYLNGTGTVAITVGAGSNGTAGTSTTSYTNSSNAGYSAFGTYCYSGGGFGSDVMPGLPGYKGTVANAYNINADTNQANYAPFLSYMGSTNMFYLGTASTGNFLAALGVNAIGIKGGHSGTDGMNATNINVAGGIPGAAKPQESTTTMTLNTIPTFDFYNLKTDSLVGAATAGTLGGAGGTAGPAGPVGLAGGGGTGYYGSGQHGQGGPGAGGAGGHGGKQLGGSGTGGNGGNAGANTGAGGGAGGVTGSTTLGTGGNGGNGAAGIVVVHWIS
jgi:hypothetical protein